VHGISLPPGEYGNGWIDRLFCNDLPADAHPYFATIQILVSSMDRARWDADAIRAVRPASLACR
jgi:AmpD protein